MCRCVKMVAFILLLLLQLTSLIRARECGYVALRESSNPFSDCTTISTLVVVTSQLTNVSFPQLRYVDSWLYIFKNAALTSVSAPLLTQCGGVLQIEGNDALTLVSLPALRTVAGDFLLSQNTQLRTLVLSSLAELPVSNQFVVQAIHGLPSLDLPRLTRAGRLQIGGNTVLSAIACPQLLTVADLALGGGLAFRTVYFPLLSTVTSRIGFFSTRLMRSFSFPRLTAVGSYVSLRDNTMLTEFTSDFFPLLTSLPGGLYLEGNPSLQSVSYSSLLTTGRIDITVSPNLTSVSFPAVESVTGLRILTNPRLETLELPALWQLGTLYSFQDIPHIVSCLPVLVVRQHAECQQCAHAWVWCENGGTCSDNGGRAYYACACAAGFNGTDCEHPLVPTPLSGGPVLHFIVDTSDSTDGVCSTLRAALRELSTEPGRLGRQADSHETHTDASGTSRSSTLSFADYRLTTWRFEADDVRHYASVAEVSRAFQRPEWARNAVVGNTRVRQRGEPNDVHNDWAYMLDSLAVAVRSAPDNSVVIVLGDEDGLCDGRPFGGFYGFNNTARNAAIPALVAAAQRRHLQLWFYSFIAAAPFTQRLHACPEDASVIGNRHAPMQTLREMATATGGEARVDWSPTMAGLHMARVVQQASAKLSMSSPHAQ